ncbi:unnamed protein product [Periconia digitata]|uniref:Uncharacterized protein n=1 Tax=Periconia digitata TaxID=1303443 RepID=A0A9W4XFW2_9PLEO|nr:unnamed protein product [Periconia digitata]
MCFILALGGRHVKTGPSAIGLASDQLSAFRRRSILFPMKIKHKISHFTLISASEHVVECHWCESLETRKSCLTLFFSLPN